MTTLVMTFFFCFNEILNNNKIRLTVIDLSNKYASIPKEAGLLNALPVKDGLCRPVSL